MELVDLQLHLEAVEEAEVLLTLSQALVVVEEAVAHLDQTPEAVEGAEVHPILDLFLGLALVAAVEGEVRPVLDLFLLLALAVVVVGEVQLVQMVVEVDESLAMGNAE